MSWEDGEEEDWGDEEEEDEDGVPVYEVEDSW